MYCYLLAELNLLYYGNMKKLISLSLITLLSCCKSKTEEPLPLQENTGRSKNEIMLAEDGVSPSSEESVDSTMAVFPNPQERIPPTQDDINLFFIQRGENYWMLDRKFEKADYYGEVLFYALIAANKFNIVEANYDIASLLSDIFTKPDFGKHSKDIVLHFHNKAEKTTFGMEQIEHFKKMKGKRAPLFQADGNGKTPVGKLKIEVLNGNRNSYDKLKKILYEKSEEERLLVYAYLMADRYNYAPARKDIVNVIEKAFWKYALGEIDAETQYFINKATEKE